MQPSITGLTGHSVELDRISYKIYSSLYVHLRYYLLRSPLTLFSHSRFQFVRLEHVLETAVLFGVCPGSWYIASAICCNLY